jgi:hypothetical protein
LLAPNGFSPPIEAQRILMATLSVELAGRVYLFEGFHYDRLSDAVAYARRTAAPVSP